VVSSKGKSLSEIRSLYLNSPLDNLLGKTTQ
jgi:hypothetical protein